MTELHFCDAFYIYTSSKAIMEFDSSNVHLS